MPTHTNSTHMPSMRAVNQILSEAQFVEQKKRFLQRTEDTLTQASQGAKHETQERFEKIALQAPAPQDPDYLKDLAEAFSAIYRQMSKTTVNQTNIFAQTQTTSERMSQAVLQATDASVAKQKVVLDEEQTAFDKQVKEQKIQEITSKIGQGLMIALAVVTVVTALFDFGVSAIALPEEVGAETALDMGEGANLELDEFSSNAEEVAEEVPKTTDGASPSEESNAELQKGEKAAQKAETKAAKNYRELSKTKRGLLKARDFLRGKWFKRAFGMTGAIVWSIPEAMNSHSTILVSKYTAKVAVDQRAIGPQAATVQRLNGYLQFFQQFARRTGSVVQGLSEELGNVIEMSSSVFGAYRQIPYGLAQAV